MFTLIGWTTDLLRIAWGLIYWNTRKTIFRFRKNGSPCPCQTRSDSGKAYQTGCEPALLYEKPARFRHVCPLLKPNGEGELKCSVNTADVRPFWGRFLGTYLGVTLLIYLSCIGAIFGTMRSIGYPVTFTMLAWPPDWNQIDGVRAEYFRNKAEAAYAAGDGPAAVMSLSLAYQYAPEDYNIGRLLAQFWSPTRPQHSDQIFEELLKKHPDRRVATARAWVLGLLARGDFNRLEQLAAQALRFDPESTAAWMQTFLFANSRTQNNGLLEELLTIGDSLPDGVAVVLALELLVQTSPPEEAKDALSKVESTAEPSFVLHYRIQRLIKLGQHHRALILLNAWSDYFSDRDRVRLELAAYAAGDYNSRYLELIRSLIRLQPSLAQIELLCSHMIAHPNQQLYTLVKQSVSPSDVPGESDRAQSLRAFYLLALVHLDQATQNKINAEIKALTGSESPALNAMTMVASNPKRYHVQNILPALQPLSFEMLYAVIEWFENISS